MRRHQTMGVLLSAALGVSANFCVAAEVNRDAVMFDDGEIVSVEYPAWFKASFMDLRDDLAESRDDGKLGLMLFFDSQGCAYCKAFVEHTLADPRLQTKTREGFDAIGLDMFSDVEITDFSGQRSTVKEFAIREGATMSPTVVFYGTDGTALLRTVGYYPPERFRLVLDYLIGGHHKTLTLREYAAKQSPQRSSQNDETGKEPPLEKGSYAFDRSRMPSQRPLLILFEGKHCQECLQLRSQVLSYPPVRQQLARFDAARLDWSDDSTALVTPTGARSNPASWAEQLNIQQVPTVVFFDEAGQEVFRVDSLVLRQRMERAMLYVLEKAYLRDMTYQQFTRAKTIEKLKANGSLGTPGG